MIAEYFSNFKRKLSRHILKNFVKTLPEKCPNTEYLSVVSPNAGKYGPEKTPYLDTFHAVKKSITKSFIEELQSWLFSGIYQKFSEQ